MRYTTLSLTSTSPHSHDNGFLCAVSTPLSTGRPTVAPRQLWEAKEDRSTFELRATDMTLDIETLKILVFLTLQLEH
jgi:hypothetical protein